MTECFSDLKGQDMIAQGRVSGGTLRNAALGEGDRKETVRENKIVRSEIFFGRNGTASYFLIIGFMPFVRMKSCSFMIFIARTVLSPIIQPRATLLRRLPWANICRPFRTKN